MDPRLSYARVDYGYNIDGLNGLEYSSSTASYNAAIFNWAFDPFTTPIVDTPDPYYGNLSYSMLSTDSLGAGISPTPINLGGTGDAGAPGSVWPQFGDKLQVISHPGASFAQGEPLSVADAYSTGAAATVSPAPVTSGSFAQDPGSSPQTTSVAGDRGSLLQTTATAGPQALDAAAPQGLTSGLQLLYAGFNYVADVNNSYADADSLATMISQTGSTSVALTADWGINASTSMVYSDIHTDTGDGTGTGQTESIANQKATATEAENDGLTVMFRPLLDFTNDETNAMLSAPDGTTYADGIWRAAYQPDNVTAFFNSYDSMIVQEAEAAQAVHAQIFDIGTELDQLTGPGANGSTDYLPYWTQIISDIRNVAGYTGKLTYSAISDDDLSPWTNENANTPVGTGDITTQISFWNQLDYVGIDEYAAVEPTDPNFTTTPTTPAQEATDLTDLIAGWEQAPTDATTSQMTGGQSLIQYYEGVSAALGKPLLFTELGYNSAPDAAVQPFFTSDTDASDYDPELQKLLYQAFIDAWQDQGNTSLQGVYLWNWEPDPSTVGAGTFPSWTPQGNAGALQVLDAAFTSDSVTCFCRGTMILTGTGEMPVEDLAIGDRVVTLSGEAKPIVWIGLGRDLVTPANKLARPVIVRQGALADNVPHRDLYLTHGHALYLHGVLIPVENLINHRTILWDDAARVVEHYHIELQDHDVVFAEGAPSETYYDANNRAQFHNTRPGSQPGNAAPTFAPVLNGGDVVERVWAELAARADAGPIESGTTEDADIHLVIDGRRVDPVSAEDSAYSFTLVAPPADPLSVRSRSGVPSLLGLNRHDHRRLGLAIAKIELRQAGLATCVAHDNPLLAAGGCHPPENGYSWTDGDLQLPGRLFAHLAGPFTLTVQLERPGMRYPIAAVAVSRAA